MPQKTIGRVPKPGQVVDRTHVNLAPSDRLGIVTRELQPEAIANALLKAERGDMGDLQEIYLKMIASDSHIRGCVGSIKSALSIYPLRISIAKSKTAEAKQALEMTETIFGGINMRRVIRSMSTVHFTGLRIYENLLTITKGADGAPQVGLTRKGLKLIPPTRYMMDRKRDSPTYGELKIKSLENPLGDALSSFTEGAFTTIDDGEEEGFFDLGGVGRTCVFWFCAKHFNAKWWAEFNELYGEPVRIGYYDDSADDTTKDEMQKYLKQLGRASWTLLPSDQQVEFIEVQKSGTIKTHQDFIALANNEMSKAIVGQIGTMGRDKYGSYGETGVLNTVRFEIVASVASLIEEALRSLVRLLCLLNISPDFLETDLPRAHIVVPNPEEKKVKAEMFEVVRHYLEIPSQYVRDELAIPEPDDDDEVLPGFGEEAGAAKDDKAKGEKEEAVDEPDAEDEPKPDEDDG